MRDPRNFLIVALVAALAFLAGTQTDRGEAVAQGYPGGTADSNNRMIAVTGTIGSGVSVLWVLDTLDRQIAVYQCKGGKSVELVAARNIEWDLKIDFLNDESRYSPEQLKRLFLGEPGADAEDSEGASDGANGGESPDDGKEGD